MRIQILFLACIVFLYSCSPIKSSPQEEKHQMELTLHEVQTNLDDLRHDFNCFQAELQIIDGKIKHQENLLSSLKRQYLEKQEPFLDQLSKKTISLEEKLSQSETHRANVVEDIRKLSKHSKDTSLALFQYKKKIGELENQILMQTKKWEEMIRLKSTLKAIASSLNISTSTKTHKIKPGDSLEKIAKLYKVSISEIKKLNQLEDDLIVVGRVLIIPSTSKR